MIGARQPKLIALFSDFGVTGPYSGQMQTLLAAAGIEQPVVQLMADAPRFAPRPSAYLLAAIAQDLPLGSLIITVVDPGVGSERRAIIVQDSGQWFLGPDNGLLSQVARRSGDAEIEEIVWRLQRLSKSFHGRDLFAPVAAAICNQEYVPGPPLQIESLVGADWPDDLAEVIYIDDFGNVITGIGATPISSGTVLEVAGTLVTHAETFSDVPKGVIFWYANSMGLIEIAVNQGCAAQALGLSIGNPVRLRERPAANI